jgi:hypothetical protein
MGEETLIVRGYNDLMARHVCPPAGDRATMVGIIERHDII